MALNRQDLSVYDRQDRSPILGPAVDSFFSEQQRRKDNAYKEEQQRLAREVEARALATQKEGIRQFDKSYGLNANQDVREAAKYSSDLASSKLKQAEDSRAIELEQLGSLNKENASISDPQKRAFHYDERVAPLQAKVMGLADKAYLPPYEDSRTNSMLDQFVKTNAQRSAFDIANIRPTAAAAEEKPWVRSEGLDANGKPTAYLINPRPKNGVVEKIAIGPVEGNASAKGPEPKPLPPAVLKSLAEQEETLRNLRRAREMLQDPEAKNRPLTGQARADYSVLNNIKHPLSDNSPTSQANRVVGGEKTWLPFVKDKPAYPQNAEFETLVGAESAKPIHDLYGGAISLTEDQKNQFLTRVGMDSTRTANTLDAREKATLANMKAQAELFGNGEYIPNPIIQRYKGIKERPAETIERPAATTVPNVDSTIGLEGKAAARLLELRKAAMEDSLGKDMANRALRMRDSVGRKK